MNLDTAKLTRKIKLSCYEGLKSTLTDILCETWDDVIDSIREDLTVQFHHGFIEIDCVIGSGEEPLVSLKFADMIDEYLRDLDLNSDEDVFYLNREADILEAQATKMRQKAATFKP